MFPLVFFTLVSEWRVDDEEATWMMGRATTNGKLEWCESGSTETCM